MHSLRSNYFFASVIFICGGVAPRLQAARPLPVETKPEYGPLHGTITLELGFTADDLQGRANLIVPLCRDAEGNSMFFLDGNWTGRGDANENASAGLAFRHRFHDPDIIIGFNGFYDYGDFSGRGYNQWGIGFELLSKWWDFRANGYFPEDSTNPFGLYSRTQSSSNRTSTRNSSSISNSTSSSTVDVTIIDGGEGFTDGSITTTTTTTATDTETRTKKKTRENNRRVRRTYARQEGPMPGFDLEVGGLIPYLDRWSETRIFAGYAFFDDPFGNDISCFTARLESRPVPALVLNVEYKGDARLVDGENHWYFCARVEIPFDLGNLIHGQSPFAGITQAFTPQGLGRGSAGPSGSERGDKKVMDPPDLMRNRMNENIIRNWRPTLSRTGYEEIAKRTTTDHEEHSSSSVQRTSSSATTTITVVVPPQPIPQ